MVVTRDGTVMDVSDEQLLNAYSPSVSRLEGSVTLSSLLQNWNVCPSISVTVLGKYTLARLEHW